MRPVVLFLLLSTYVVAQAEPAVQTGPTAQELIDIYLKAPVKTGEVTPEEMSEIGNLYGKLGKLNKVDYQLAIEFLRDNWNINESNAQRLFIFLQKDWNTRIGQKVQLAEISTESVDSQIGFAVGTTAMVLNYLTLLRPILGFKYRAASTAFTFSWSSGVPVATTFAASPILQKTFRTEAAEHLLKVKPASPADIVGIKMTMPDSQGENTLTQYELEQLQYFAGSLLLTGLANDLAKLRPYVTGVKTAGATGGRVLLALTLAAAVGYIAETGIDVYVQNNQFENIAKELRHNIKALNSMKLLNDKQKISARVPLRAQNLYAQTINLMQVEFIGYLKAAKENVNQLDMLKEKVAANLCENPQDTMWHSSWRKDSDEADLYHAQKDMRDGMLNSLRNKQCQSEVDQYLNLTRRIEEDPSDKRAQISLGHLKNYLVKQFSEGKFCGGDSALLSGHPLNLLLSASLYLKDFSPELTWLQSQSLDDRFMDLYESYMYQKNLNLLSPHERKVRDGELPDPAWTVKRKKTLYPKQ